MKTIKSISEIPYCGEIWIEGFFKTDKDGHILPEVEDYTGITSSNRSDAPNAFVAKWSLNEDGTGSEYKRVYTD